MIVIAELAEKHSTRIEWFKQFEYEALLFVFLLLRFVFKNINDIVGYFTAQPVFNMSDSMSITAGVILLIATIFVVAKWFGKLIKTNAASFEKPFLYFIALFLACPATFPFLFDAAEAGGSQLLYPYALFIFSVFITDKPVVKWLLPLVCAAYYIPAAYSGEVFFEILRKGAILYVPLILLFLFSNMMRTRLAPENKNQSIDIRSSPSLLFVFCLVASIGSYVYTLFINKPYYMNFYNFAQHLDGSFITGLLIAAPAAAAAFVVTRIAAKNKLATGVADVFIYAPILLFLFFRNNFTGLWIPFFLLSVYMFILSGLRYKNPAILAATTSVGLFFERHKFLFILTLMVTASLSDTSSPYLANAFQTVFRDLPF